MYFIESRHHDKFFGRGKIYGENDDFKRFSYFSRAALEFLHQSGKKPDIIHCHDWPTALVVCAISFFFIAELLFLWPIRNEFSISDFWVVFARLHCIGRYMSEKD